ncbi:hypothetical protein EDC45_0293 [Mesocricetibacter intestinalis]|uniref:Uncharacterized protein n=1 Tax=Mesocricetibacter intestinalis TaxID=1521930 RepID=A0A4R6VF74_9PAST|nr:hypothetical protein EDC45_0293 [Mesocricetibacter intestinalis]
MPDFNKPLLKILYSFNHYYATRPKNGFIRDVRENQNSALIV